VVVVGAGILGLATARELVRRVPSRRVLVLEKEARVAAHQTGHNSGVIHSGLYYAPGSAKARLCVQGRTLLVDYCRDNHIPFELCGKLVVAVDEAESVRLDGILERGRANGLGGVAIVPGSDIASVEPAVRGVRALWVPEAGIVDFARVAATLAAEIASLGVAVELGTPLAGLDVGRTAIRIETPGETIEAESVIACAGLHSDRLAVMAGGAPYPRIVPFRGDYYLLRPERRELLRGLVYPVPDPRFPFLGVHFTRRMDGSRWLGPNAVLAFAREGYRRSDVDLGDLARTLGDGGFRTFAVRHWRIGLAELARDYLKPLFLAVLRRYVPELTLRDLLPGPSGVRAQALDAHGALLDDFAFDAIGRFLNVRNAPSPAATSSLALAREFVDKLETALA
jgi:L-2-hydroxyglutarate oxidase LhgO